jgi:endonuclease YncB( thermonuclease family)
MGGADRMGKPVASTTRRIGIGAACLAMVGLLVAASIARDDWLARDVALEPDRTAAVAAPAPQDVPIAEPAPTAPESPERSRSARPVAPDVVAVPPVVPETLERVEPRTPLSPLGLATRQADLPPRPTLLPRPHAVAAGRFHSRGHVVTLAGIEIVEAEEKCGEGQESWPCGTMARTAFRNWLRGRALSCVVPVSPVPGEVVTPCTLGRQDAGEWLVRQGWAHAVAGGPYEEAEAEAREAGRGLHGGRPQLSPLAGAQ